MSYYTGHGVTVHHGDALNLLPTLDDCTVDAVVTDPPYGLEFMGKEWDRFKTDRRGVSRTGGVAVPGVRGEWVSGRPQSYDAGVPYQSWCQRWAAECLRVLKPGGHLLAFGGTRTSHRLAAGIEDAGFEIRDSLIWLYGSGFPKSLDVSKAIDKANGAEREVTRDGTRHSTTEFDLAASSERERRDTPATDEARRWAGWGTSLKPGHEPVVVARKPLAGTVAQNVLTWGTGGLNVDGCRIGTDEDTSRARATVGDTAAPFGRGYAMGGNGSPAGRWPANVVLDEVAAAELDRQSGESTSGNRSTRGRGGNIYAGGEGFANSLAETGQTVGFGDAGGASRFFYTAKADSGERIRLDTPCEVHGIRRCTICLPKTVSHPTVKPLDLCRWLVRLVTPPGGVVLDPFAGSGTTAEACILERFRCITVEREIDYLPMIVQRVNRRRDPAKAVPRDNIPSLFDLLGETP